MSRQISVEEVKKHADQRSCWVIIHNDVYDVTQFLNEHPGGAEALLEYAGKDGTEAFENVSHSAQAKQLMLKYKIGSVSSHGSHCCCGPHHMTTCLHSGFVPCPKNVVVLPVTRTKSKDDMVCGHGKSRHSHGPLGFMKGPCQHCTNDPKTLRGPRPEDHVKSIIVPKERCSRTPRRRQAEPDSGGKLKWALIILASALVVAIAVKKMKG